MNTGLRRGLVGCSICCALVVAIVLIVWLAVSPQDPKFQVDSFSISNFTVGNDSKVSFAADVGLTVRNPNRHLSVWFGRIDGTLSHKSSVLAGSRTSGQDFSLGKKSQATVRASFAAAGSFTERGNVGFDLRLVCNAGFQKSVFRMRRHDSLKVFCGDLVVGIPSNGTQGGGGLVGGPKRCRVK